MSANRQRRTTSPMKPRVVNNNTASPSPSNKIVKKSPAELKKIVVDEDKHVGDDKKPASEVRTKIATETFSFRLFDFYRRFVEIAAQNPKFLAILKTGQPSEAVCYEVICLVFLHSQSLDNVVLFTNYIKRNAASIANHAEHTPDNWEEACRYTDGCIKLIRHYLRSHSISLKKLALYDKVKITDIAKNISKEIFGEASEKQVDNVYEYLRLDLHNPKRKTLVNSPKSVKKDKKKSKKDYKIKGTTTEGGENNELKLKIVKTNAEPLSLPVEDKKNDNILKLNIKSETDAHIESPKTKNMNNSEENCYSICDSASRKMLQIEEIKSQDQYTFFDENGKNLSEFLAPNLVSNEITIEIDDGFVKDTDTEETVRNSIPFTLKRKSPSDFENKAKKFISNHSVVLNNEQRNLNNINNKSFGINSNPDIELLKDSKSDTNSYIDIESNDPEDVKLFPSNFNIDEQNVAVKKEVEEVKDNKKYCTCRVKLDESEISKIQQMTYNEAQKLTDVIMTFCEMKKEITLEEFLVLRRIRDAFQLKSLKKTIHDKS